MKINVACSCPFCGTINLIKNVDFDALVAWKNGALIQDVLPNLNPNEREMLKTGICPKCWDDMFSPEPEEDEEDWGDEPDYNLDMGFDPYMGCYTDDC